MPTVLLVDDEREVGDGLKTFFDLQNIPCWVATDGDQALTLLAEHTPDLVLLDVRLHGSRLNGLDVLKEAKQRWPTVKVFMVTGYDDTDSHAQAERWGADGYLEKPVTPDKLLDLLKRMTSSPPR